MICRLLLLAVLAAFSSGCNVLDSPIVSQSRSVSRVANQGRALNVGRNLNFTTTLGGSRSIAFPPGVYPLEAEDAAYWYFRAPTPIQFSEISADNWMPRMQMGGLMIAKGSNPIPGGGYIDGTGSTKILVWKMGGEILALEGQTWKKNF